MLDAAALADALAQSVRDARAVGEPFFHLAFDRVFPADVYLELLASMPTESFTSGGSWAPMENSPPRIQTMPLGAGPDGGVVFSMVGSNTIRAGIESGGTDGVAAKIKSHHNVGGLPADVDFELVEPLRMLFKDEVRRVGGELGYLRIGEVDFLDRDGLVEP